ncbi:hypothetical protein [Streptomyces sp. NPDC088763]|uniref:hypothetical protein n=1 Tax=Streptomyces sp. NPDC088763 TaxID=3365892 RepID=UPI0037FF5ACC
MTCCWSWAPSLRGGRGVRRPDHGGTGGVGRRGAGRGADREGRGPRQACRPARARWLRPEALDALGAVREVASGGAPGDGAPGLDRGTVVVRGAGDARLELPGWTRGFVWVGGFRLGRSWPAGPQRALCGPGPVLRRASTTWGCRSWRVRAPPLPPRSCGPCERSRPTGRSPRGRCPWRSG